MVFHYIVFLFFFQIFFRRLVTHGFGYLFHRLVTCGFRIFIFLYIFFTQHLATQGLNTFIFYFLFLFYFFSFISIQLYDAHFFDFFWILHP